MFEEELVYGGLITKIKLGARCDSARYGIPVLPVDETIAEPTSPRCPATNTREPSASRTCSAMGSAPRIDFVPSPQQCPFLARQFQIVLDHGADQFFEADFGLPP